MTELTELLRDDLELLRRGRPDEELARELQTDAAQLRALRTDADLVPADLFERIADHLELLQDGVSDSIRVYAAEAQRRRSAAVDALKRSIPTDASRTEIKRLLELWVARNPLGLTDPSANAEAYAASIDITVAEWLDDLGFRDRLP